MSITRNNHYVPQWYQERFFESGKNTLAYLDMTPPQEVLANGRKVEKNSRFQAPTSRAFRQLDLYSTFFGTSVNDEIERQLFGDIDTRGSVAVRAFTDTDVSEQHRHFETFFEYIDIQKVRTPKGLDWLRAQYPMLSQNELMMEMQGIRMMHCTVWTEGVREIVSAEDAGIKFLVSDHPVTIYNHAVPPVAKGCRYPFDPSIALKGSQTIFPLNRDFCLILTNLEYARDPEARALEKRTFARNYRQSMVRTDAFIRTRKLSDQEVAKINFILKARARRYIAAGREEWLYPEKLVAVPWADLRNTLRPPEDGHWLFGGEMFAGFDSGYVHYQDEFGRTEAQREFLSKPASVNPLRPRDDCGCGSGLPFRECCNPKPLALRPAWGLMSIRERNLMLFRGIVKILAFEEKEDWVQVRRDLTDEKISEVYRLFDGLWPLETDMLQLLPKPDGVARAVYTGSIHPSAIADHALGACLYFGELIIEHPFLHAGTMKKEFSPVENPGLYRQEFIKTIVFMMKVMPFVQAGLVNLVPDLCYFDRHLRLQMMEMATFRAAGMSTPKDARIEALMRADAQRSIMSLPRDVLRRHFSMASTQGESIGVEEALGSLTNLREADPLAVLHSHLEPGKKNGDVNLVRLAPNFEMSMYLAQATGAAIITDSAIRWRDVQYAILRKARSSDQGLPALAANIERDAFAFLTDISDIRELAADRLFAPYSALMAEGFRYLTKFTDPGFRRKPNLEASIATRFVRTHSAAQKLIRKRGMPSNEARIACLLPIGGVQDNTINRLLLTSSSEHHLSSVPMAYFIEPTVRPPCSRDDSRM
ncbi:hypothetical protein RGR602_CH02362 [Rhizobium gallicum bv. gallicum R602sp]|uniref:DUF4238 domain-containing protein n=2 Tax=Rhizobium gallicum TaxID=56730 RepID=A0A0B4X579_9HYPH|nr:hypothetical protein RGR602_CH02362 [Rhizobium gallicum bv. gallicum R602sp]